MKLFLINASERVDERVQDREKRRTGNQIRAPCTDKNTLDISRSRRCETKLIGAKFSIGKSNLPFIGRALSPANAAIMLKIQMLEQIVSNENMREQQEEQQRQSQSPNRSPTRSSSQNGLVFSFFPTVRAFFLSVRSRPAALTESSALPEDLIRLHVLVRNR